MPQHVNSIGLMPCESKIRYYPTGSRLNRSAPGGGGLEGKLGPGTSPYLLVPCNDLFFFFFLSLKHRPRMHSLQCGKLPEPQQSLNSHQFIPEESDRPWTWTLHDQKPAFWTVWVCRWQFQPNKYSDGMNFIWKWCPFSWKLHFFFFFSLLLLT